jgi:hypothetical protein
MGNSACCQSNCCQNCGVCLGCSCCCRINGCCSCLACRCCASPLLLPQQDANAAKRKVEVEKAAKIYEYQTLAGTGTPVILKGGSALVDEATFQQFANLTDIGFNLLKGNITGEIREILAKFGKQCSPLDEYKKLFRNPPKIAETWRTDESFGYLRLAGLNPTRIFKIDSSNFANKINSSRFPVTDELLEGVLPQGETLQNLSSKNRLFMTESPETEGLNLPGGNFVPAPIALYYLDANAKIMPLAIQLYEDPTKGAGLIYTPKSKKNTWLAAKIHVAYTDMMIHSFSSHVYAMHTAMESMWIIMNRCLSEKHPLLAFFTPHFYQLLIVNFGIRKTLDPNGDLEKLTGVKNAGIVELVRRSYASWTLDDIDVDKDFEKRGVNDIPGYYFRDDSKAYFGVMKKYAKSIVSLMYTTPNDMTADYELQHFLGECGGVGLYGMPKSDSLEDLSSFIAKVLFWCTVRHSYVETAGFALYPYPPASPLKFTLKPEEMTADVELDDAAIQKHLASMSEAADQIALIRSVEIRANDNYYLGYFSCKYLAGLEGADVVIGTFIEELKAVDKKIVERNQQLEKSGKTPFTYLELKDLYSSIWN